MAESPTPGGRMTSRVVVIDYGSGNLHSAGKAIERAARETDVNAQIVVSADPGDVRGADRVVLPGVGAFGDCYAGLSGIPGMLDALDDVVMHRTRPFFGICVGMQLMASRGLEFGIHPGLGWIAGEVRAIVPDDPSLKIPHMGWNTLQVAGHGGAGSLKPDTTPPLSDGQPKDAIATAASAGVSSDVLDLDRTGPTDTSSHPLFEGITLGQAGWHAYFVHSFHFVPEDEDDCIAVTDYGGSITAAVARDNLFGTQFHPEKSQALGLRLLGNFLRWSP
ncbi:MAG: imidazole glycerol phosphate synthase subunit HisH [Pseudomonadota bacterium]